MKHTLLKTVTFLWLLAVWQLANAQLWEVLDPLPEGSGGYRGHFVDSQNGWVFRTGSTQLLRTRDGGNTWTELYPMTGMRYIFMADTLVGYMIVQEDMMKLFKTSDGGSNWTLNPLQFSFSTMWFDNVNPLYFIDTKVGFVANEETYMKTTDGGSSWIPTNFPDVATYRKVCNIAFLNDSVGWIATYRGLGGVIYFTTNQGQNWEVLFRDYDCSVTSFDIANQDTIITSGYCPGMIHYYGDAKLTKNNFDTICWENTIIEQRFSMFLNDTTILFYGSKLWTMHIDSTAPVEITDLPSSISAYNFAQKVQGTVYLTGGSNIAKRTDTAYVSIQNRSRIIEKGTVYPNPATVTITVAVSSYGSKAVLNIYNLMGKNLMQQKTVNTETQNIDVSILPPGVYILTVENREKIYYSKFIKQ